MLKDIAYSQSPVLNAAFNGRFKEAGTLETCLDDFEYPLAFGLLQEWMYSHKVTGRSPLLVALWVLTDRLLMPQLQNATMAAIGQLNGSQAAMWDGLLPWTYENTSVDSELRAYIERNGGARGYLGSELAVREFGEGKLPEAHVFGCYRDMAMRYKKLGEQVKYVKGIDFPDKRPAQLGQFMVPEN